MKENAVRDALTPILIDLGLELDALEIMPAGKRSVLRVVVDGDGASGQGPDLDEIAAATRAVSVALDESEDVGKAPYTLEVTSRGVSRPLTRPAHWRRNRGRLVKVSGSDGELTGRITGADDEAVTLDIDGSEQRFVFAGLGKALIQIEFNRPKAAETSAAETSAAETSAAETPTTEEKQEG